MMQRNINGNTSIFALFGYPAKHSLSPIIHNYLFERYSINSVYLVFEVKPKNFKESITSSKILNFEGFNITMPFKKEIIGYLDNVSNDAMKISSVNTVVKIKNKYNGYNTDITGFCRSLEERNFDFKGSAALIIGAGGAARSCVLGLINNQISQIFIYNRTISKANELKRIFSNNNKEKQIEILNDLYNLNNKDLNNIKLIVNCTSLGMDYMDNLNKLPIPDNWNIKDKYIFEMVYNPIDTILVKKARSEGAIIINGLDMLVNQALSSFKIWNGFYPNKKDLMNYLIKFKKYSH